MHQWNCLSSLFINGITCSLLETGVCRQTLCAAQTRCAVATFGQACGNFDFPFFKLSKACGNPDFPSLKLSTLKTF